jgi:soluble cytochrome b562|tara:strand:+ start:510 stop:638 length:129 start_codon:yes stop_codon:yes gene_type:complete
MKIFAKKIDEVDKVEREAKIAEAKAKKKEVEFGDKFFKSLTK